jgi:hypothetical protein
MNKSQYFGSNNPSTAKAVALTLWAVCGCLFIAMMLRYTSSTGCRERPRHTAANVYGIILKSEIAGHGGSMLTIRTKDSFFVHYDVTSDLARTARAGDSIIKPSGTLICTLKSRDRSVSVSYFSLKCDSSRFR